LTSAFKLSDISAFLLDLLKQEKASYLFFFVVALALRGIPELLITRYPVGYETITYYAPVMTRFQEMSLVEVFAKNFHAGPLFYVLMWLTTAISNGDAFLLLKVTGPLLYGCLSVVFFVFLRRGLGWRWKMAFVASLLLVCQVAALRIAWDRFRNVLGLIFVFAALTVLRGNYRFKWPLVASLAVLAVLSREYVGLILIVGVFGYALLEGRSRSGSFAALVPALFIFVGMVYPWLGRSWIGGFDYSFGSYIWVVQDVLSIFAVCYLALVPFVLKGFRRDSLLDPLLGLLLFGSFSVAVVPWLAVPGYQRWLMLLVFPFSVYAVLGFEHFRLLDKGFSRKLAAILLVFIVIGGGYSTGVFSYVGKAPNSYVAVDLTQSSIVWSQIDDVVDVLRWLDENALSNSSVLAEERFYGWTLIYLDRASSDVEVVPYGAGSPPWAALEKALNNGFRCVYLIWYTDSTLDDFQMVYSRNSVSVFEYGL